MDVGVIEILNKLDDEEIIGLANTVTQGLLKNKIENRKDAIEAILKHSPNELSILRRKCITKDVLFSYSHQNDIQITLPITKPELIDVIYTFWKNKACNNGTNNISNISSSIDPCKSTTIFTQDHGNYQDSTSNVNNMAEQFSAWFYSMLNESQPMGREHFWNDAKLTISILNNTECQNQEVEGDTLEIVNLLFKLRQEYNLMFNPNLVKDGVQGRLDPHGLVLVLACGTLHVDSDCVGVFEQVFALVRDPSAENNWKIKKSELILRRKRVNAVPKLCDSKLTGSLLQLPSS